MQNSPTECRTVGRTGQECVECLVTKMNVKIPMGSCIYRTLVGPALDERAETLKKAEENKLGVAEI